MRFLVFILFFFYVSVCEGKSIYVSSTSGNDNNTGLSSGQAWRTLWKLNLMFPTATVVAGDVILFERGSTFIGKFTITKQVTFDVYGSGAKPVISGFCDFGTWTNVSGNVWQATPDSVLKKFCNILTIADVPQAVGRYPNGTTFLTFQSATTTQLTSTAIAGQNWAKTEVVIRKIAYIAERAIVTSQSGNTLTYGTTPAIDPATTSVNRNATEGTGFFFQRFRGSLDAQGEWYYNDTLNRMFLYSTTNPNSLVIKASYADTLVGLGSMANISFNNIKFEGANKNVFLGKDGDGITITNCDFVNNTRVVNFHNVGLVNVTGCTFNHTFNTGIFVYSTGKSFMNYNNNVFTNTGQLFGMGIFATEGNLRVMYVLGSRVYNANQYINIVGNRMIKTGSSVIYYNGSNIIIRRNVIDTFNNLLDDGGAIYTYKQTEADGNYFNRLIDSNFVSNSVGAPNGAGGSQSSAIYNDGFTNQVTAKNNTIYNLTGTLKGNGVQTSNPKDVLLKYNTIYNTDVTINVNIINYVGAPPFSGISNTRIDSNILYQKTNAATKYIDRHINVNLQNPPLTYIQSVRSWFQNNNWISNQAALSYTLYYSPLGNGSYTFKFWNLQQWRDTSLHDINSILPPVALTNTNTTLHVNPSDVPLTVNFTGLQKLDPKGVAYNDYVTIPRWSSRLLIDNGASTMNIPPVANAGSNQTVTLPTNSTSVTATATDADGTVVGYTWIKFSGPAGGNITSPNSATTTITGLIQGTYIFQVTATDNLGATGNSQMQIVVNPVPNQAPVANAGADQTVQLPVPSVTLNGSGNDPDGSIIAYAWVKISGPPGGNISNASSPSTTINSLQQGIYKYQLTVTDNGSPGLTDKDTVQITVTAADNLPPTSTPGADQSITLPTTTTTFNGSGTDPDGVVVAYLWSFVSGPSTPSITSPTNSVTNITGLSSAGEYIFSLRVTDNGGLTDTKLIKVTVNAANIAPTANAGIDQTITLPTNSTTLSGGGSDPDGSIVGYSWLKISGPAGGTITSPTSATTGITALQQGTYVYRLIVTDDDGATGQDFMQIVVNPANIAPTANAGTDSTITLPTNTTTLIGSGSDPDGTIVSYAWVKISGPAGGNITSPSSATTGITALQQGTYVYRLTVTDDDGATGQDFVQVLVNPAVPPPNIPPTANAGSDQFITLPTNTTTLVGSGNDPDGTIAAYLWTKISGPSGGAITSPTNSTTGITALIAGVYIYQLRVTDNSGDTATDAIQVTVNAANIAPTANAGADQIITLPTSTTSLVGSGTDPDGTISAYLWTKISGPTGGTIATPTTSSTNISALQAGVYTFQLRVTDNVGDTATDAVQVTVNAANILPSANAGSDQVITLPTNTTTLVGSGTDPDGTIASYLWVKVSGPSGGAITSSTSATTGITGLLQGIYIYRLRVTDNAGDTATDAMQVTVNAAPVNQAPTANAGSNQTLLLPSNSTTLLGSGSDVDGTISTYGWIKISGGAATINSPSNATTNITGLVAGIYQFELTVTDNLGLTGKDTVQVTVNTPPTANAGSDVVITLPVNFTTLDGTGSANNIQTYSWVKLSGVGGTITTPSGSTTTVTGLVQGTYLYELTVVDNNGNSATDQVQVTVLPADIPPSANAGANQSITLPINTVTLTGSGADVDGTIVAYNWQVLSGPSGSNFGTSNAATTTFNNLTAISPTIPGVYQVRLTVTDNAGGTGNDVVQITVNPVVVPPNAVVLKGYKVISN